MKLEDCKVGMLVLATKKSCTALSIFSMEDFLRKHPLGVSRIMSFSKDGWVSVGGPFETFTFLPEDLIPIKGTINSW